MLNFGTVIFMFVMRNLKARRANIAFINTVQILLICVIKEKDPNFLQTGYPASKTCSHCFGIKKACGRS
jgi:hypothetical protein